MALTARFDPAVRLLRGINQRLASLKWALLVNAVLIAGNACIRKLLGVASPTRVRR